MDGCSDLQTQITVSAGLEWQYATDEYRLISHTIEKWILKLSELQVQPLVILS